MKGKTIEIRSPDQSSQVELEAETGKATLRYNAPDGGIALAAEINLMARLDEEGKSAFRDLCQAADQTAHSDLSVLKLQTLGRRAQLPLKRIAAQIGTAAEWLVSSSETTNHTYELTQTNKTYLAHTIAVVTGTKPDVVQAFMNEAESDTALAQHIANVGQKQSEDIRAVTDSQPRFGRRLGWYVLVRILKPRFVIETGVDKGLGAVLLCAALKRNTEDGAPGRYLGTDINEKAGYLLAPPYDVQGQIAYGDSLETLKTITEPVDLFINDSDHSSDYESDEYRCIARLLSERSVIVGDNAHVTPKLAEFADETDRRFLYWQEKPAGHWYPGGGIGFAFR